MTRVMSAFVIRTITHSVIAETVDRRSGCPVNHAADAPAQANVPGSELSLTFAR
jgi:hypothetical protein